MSSHEYSFYVRHPCERSPLYRHPDGSRDPDFPLACRLKVWVPAFAGMTDYCLELYSYIND